MVKVTSPVLGRGERSNPISLFDNILNLINLLYKILIIIYISEIPQIKRMFYHVFAKNQILQTVCCNCKREYYLDRVWKIIPLSLYIWFLYFYANITLYDSSVGELLGNNTFMRDLLVT